MRSGRPLLARPGLGLALLAAHAAALQSSPAWGPGLAKDQARQFVALGPALGPALAKDQARSSEVSDRSIILRNLHDSRLIGQTGWKSVHSSFERLKILTDGQGFRQPMESYEDMQYLVNFTMGGQSLVGLLDTGSFEMVVFDKECKACGRGPLYDPLQSGLHKPGEGITRQLHYSSGPLFAEDGADTMTMGPYKLASQSIWEVKGSGIEEFQYSQISAIVGLGPPESSILYQWESARNEATRVIAELEVNGTFNKTMATNAKQLLDGAVRAGRHPTVLRNMDEGMFSICLGKDKASGGTFIWNDTSAVLHPELFHKVPVSTSHSWKVEVRNMRLSYLRDVATEASNANVINDVPFPKDPSSVGGASFLETDSEFENDLDLDWSHYMPQDDDLLEGEVFDNSTSVSLGCEQGCDVLLDTGTSVLAMPYWAEITLERVIQEGSQGSCGNMLKLPHLVFEMNGRTFSLAPDAYAVTTKQTERGDDEVALEQETGSQDCSEGNIASELVVDKNWIFGLPFFRKYYTSFQVGHGASQRAVHFAGASAACTPIKSRVEVHDGPADQWTRYVDPEVARLVRRTDNDVH